MIQNHIEHLKTPKLVALIFIIITLLFSYPLYNNLNNWGIHDWDQHLLYEGVPQATITQYHQFPLWNPYQCGGNVMLANPQSSFLSIHFPLTLLFGEVIATKLAIMLYLFIGLLGMWYVCRKLELSPIASYVPPIILMLSGVYAVRMTVGHTNWFYLAYIPWIFLCYLKTKENKRYIIPASLLLALIYLGGGIHPFIITILVLVVHATIEAIRYKRIKQITTIFLILLLFMPFAAIKLIPTLAVQNEMLPIEQTDTQPNSLALLYKALVENNPDLTYSTSPLWQWHEYYGYIGVLPLLLSLFTFVLWKKTKTYILATITILIIIFSQNLFPTVWNLIYKIPFASLFHGPSRFLFAAIFFIAILTGYTLTYVENNNKRFSKILIMMIFLFLLFDLTSANSPLLEEGFTIEPQETIQTDFYSIYADNNEYTNQQYTTFLSNRGIWNCYERFYPKEQGAIPKETLSGQQYGNYVGEAYVAESNTPRTITYWSPNKVIIEATPGTLVLNQNYITGWKATVNNKKQDVFSYNGAIATEVKEATTFTFYYLPNAFIVGLLVSVICLLVSYIYFKHSK
jgi:hypothetical protein